MNIIDTYTTHHVSSTIVNSNEEEPEDEQRIETTIDYHIHFFIDPYTRNIEYKIEAERTIEEFYYTLNFHLKQNLEDYYIPYHTMKMCYTVQFENLSYEIQTYILEKIKKMTFIQNYMKEYVFTELFEKALHPDRIEWFMNKDDVF